MFILYGRCGSGKESSFSLFDKEEEDFIIQDAPSLRAVADEFADKKNDVVNEICQQRNDQFKISPDMVQHLIQFKCTNDTREKFLAAIILAYQAQEGTEFLYDQGDI